MLQCWNGGRWGNKGSKLLGHGFRTKYDVIVAIMKACGTVTTHWVFGKFEAKSCDSVETVTQGGIRGQNCLAIVLGQHITSLLPKQRLVPPWQPTEICGEFDADSCDSVETVAQKRIGGQICLEVVFEQNMTSLLPSQPLVPPWHLSGLLESWKPSHVTVLKRWHNKE